MTQAGRACALEVSQQTVFAHEIAERRVSVLILSKLAKIFDLPTDQLINRNRRAIVVKVSKPRLSPRAARHEESNAREHNTRCRQTF